jgi:hypothetical protein
MQTGEETMALVNAPSHIMHVDVCMAIQNKDWEKTKTNQLMPKSQNVCGCVHD